MSEETLIYLASAGSGKTRKISMRFLELSRENPLNSIIAITFTKKAASEMRERVIEILKKIILDDENLELSKELKINRKKAFEVLKRIIENYSEFQITTIDSFMNKIFKAFSVEFGISPDYEITFDRDEIFETSLNELLETKDEKLKKSVLEYLKALLNIKKGGFDPVKILKNGLKDFDRWEIKSKFGDDFNISETIGGDEINKALQSSILKMYPDYREFVRDITDLEGILKELFEKLKYRVKIYNDMDLVKKNLIKWIEKDFTVLDKTLDKKSSFLHKEAEEFFKKGKKEKAEDFENFQKLFNTFTFLFKKNLLLKKFMEGYHSYLILRELEKFENDIKRELNVVDGDSIVEKVKNKLSEFPENNGVTYAFIKLGDKINNYLIDEFQDTSIPQWKAMELLLEEARSSGGSLFVVGDKKQAIYGWREGDYRVFDKVDGKKVNLSNNYRSKKEIVEFNNKIFLNLKRWAEDNKESGSFIGELDKVYSDVKQNIFKKESGFVSVKIYEVNKKNKEKNSEIEIDVEEEWLKPNFFDLLDDLLKRFSPEDIVVLGRSKGDIEKIVYWVIEYQKERKTEFPFITEESLRLLSNLSIKNLLSLTSYLLTDDKFFLKGLVENEFLKVGDKFKGNLTEDSRDKLNLTREFLKDLSPYEFFLKIVEIFKDELKIYENGAFLQNFLEVVLDLTNSGKTIIEIVEYFFKNRDLSLFLPDSKYGMRIMTIHKAKGLQGKVVVIPLYNWKIKNYSFVKFKSYDTSIFGKELKGVKSFLKLNNGLTKLDKETELILEALRVKEWIENINLMYVSNTRAMDELYILGYFKKNNLNSGKLLYELIKSAKFDSELESKELKEDLKLHEISMGKKVLKGKKGERENIEDKRDVKFFPKFNDIRRDLKGVEGDIFLEGSEIEFGNLFHLAMSFIDELNSIGEIDERVKMSLEKLPQISDDRRILEIEKFLKRTLRDLSYFFSGFEWAFNEKEFVSKDGVIFRVDRILKKDGKIYLIDYKTGRKEESHLRQIRNYMGFLSELGKLSGILYYVKEGEILNVSF